MSLSPNILFTCALLLSLRNSSAQGTITFDGPPAQPPGTAKLVQLYDEGGVWFVPILGTDGFTRRGGGNSLYPENGTAYLQTTLGDSLMFGLYDGSAFDMLSVELAEYSTVRPEAVTVRFVGHRQDGSIVATDLTTDGVFDGGGPVADFQTFYFGPEFSNLVRVEIPGFGW